MKKILFIFNFIYATHFSCVAQKEIVYELETSVIDSIQGGIKMYQKLHNKKETDLKLFIVMVEHYNEFEIYLQENSHLPKGGFLELINTTNRKLLINSQYKIPILLPADKMSLQAKKDKIDGIPLSGFYIKFIYEDNKQKVIETAILY